MGLQKYRSLIDYAAILAGDREGFNIGLDGAIFVRREATPRVFERPRIGTQGSSIGGASASTDISAGSDDKLDIAVDGGAAVTVTLTLAGLTTGAAIEAELETQINAALAAAGQDARVWVEYDSGDDHYEVYSQKTGTTSAVVITDASSDNVADDLNLGTANGATEAAGTDDQDFFLFTTGGPTFEQPIESNPHRTGRFHTGIVRQKKVASFDMSALLNMNGSAGDSIDTALRLLLLSIFGKETVTPAQYIDYEQGLPNFTFSMVRASTIFSEFYSGAYCKDYTLTAPGDAPVTQQFTGGAEKAAIAGIGQADGAVVSSTTVQLNATHAQRYRNEGANNKARVMAVSPDGRTIVAGADGTLTVEAVDTGTDQLTLSAAIDLADDGYIVPWNPGAVQQTGRDNIFTDLEGSFKFNSSGNTVCATNITLSFVNDHIDINNCFGADANEGFVAGNRATISLEVTLDLSNENFGDLVQTREFGGFDAVIEIGPDPVSGRSLEITMPKWIVSVPPIDLPENGTTPVTFSGNLYQSNAGARDPIKFRFK